MQAEVLYEETLPAVAVALKRTPGAPRELPIVTGFLGRGLQTGASAMIYDMMIPPCVYVFHSLRV